MFAVRHGAAPIQFGHDGKEKEMWTNGKSFGWNEIWSTMALMSVVVFVILLFSGYFDPIWK